jgi:hypothetical protein
VIAGVVTGCRKSSALARTRPAKPPRSAMAKSAGTWDAGSSAAAAKVVATVVSRSRRVGSRVARSAAAHAAPSSAWQSVQALGVPARTERSGRGMRKL